jgi:hypothetical protein
MFLNIIAMVVFAVNAGRGIKMDKYDKERMGNFELGGKDLNELYDQGYR